MATGGELVSTQMPKKLQVENWLHEFQLLSSVTLHLGGTVNSLLGNSIPKVPINATSEHLDFKIFLGSIPADPLVHMHVERASCHLTYVTPLCQPYALNLKTPIRNF